MSDRTYEAGGIYVTILLEFKSRCCEKLEDLGDTAMNTSQCGEAISQYSAALALDLVAPQGLLIKRSKAYIAGGLWDAALNDANKVCPFVSRMLVLVKYHHQVIELDPLSPWGYERKHVALHKAGNYENAINAFEAMLLKMSQSSDPEIRGESVHIILKFIY